MQKILRLTEYEFMVFTLPVYTGAIRLLILLGGAEDRGENLCYFPNRYSKQHIDLLNNFIPIEAAAQILRIVPLLSFPRLVFPR